MTVAARAGFAARGLIYLLVGVIALQIAFAGDGKGRQADRGGALGELAEKPFGSAMLWTVGIALAGMALWRLSEAVFGGPGSDGSKLRKRAASAARSVFYAFVSYSVLAYAAGDRDSGSGSSDKHTDDVTAVVLKWPGGQWLVGVAGVAVVVAGLWIAVRAVRKKFRKHLRTAAMSPRTRRVTDVLGVTGGTARGIVFAVAGVFAVVAAVQHRPGRAKGMDDTLRSFRDLPAGPWLLALIALGLAAFGVFSWCNARWREV
ncbi:membrane protein [Streptomyces lucensis JCM 4490]|uniref:Membrane protein n=2 Tax=Streptomyces lucensis TaxID=67319 RepID=A0A918JG60_9ACTN|nr:membrane protein [Streptomyces lucensis JCM 4490]